MGIGTTVRGWTGLDVRDYILLLNVKEGSDSCQSLFLNLSVCLIRSVSFCSRLCQVVLAQVEGSSRLVLLCEVDRSIATASLTYWRGRWRDISDLHVEVVYEWCW